MPFSLRSQIKSQKSVFLQPLLIIQTTLTGREVLASVQFRAENMKQFVD